MQGPLVSTLLDLVSTHCPKTAQKRVISGVRESLHETWFLVTPDSSFFLEGPLVSTLLDLVSTHYPKTAQKEVMKNQWSPMGQSKSDEHPPYE
ncbi:hypothetical protein Taro_020456 [Colocasia esculenta]|uniref:Uncharacterized protein n=1 Tax=Colocasia esculenta TaxID=4460 RepID=A0A843UYU9_COLES|nr:hypothetical protein [Colocasia esculenta]